MKTLRSDCLRPSSGCSTNLRRWKSSMRSAVRSAGRGRWMRSRLRGPSTTATWRPSRTPGGWTTTTTSSQQFASSTRTRSSEIGSAGGSLTCCLTRRRTSRGPRPPLCCASSGTASS
eukprot:Rmarinus@m.13234